MIQPPSHYPGFGYALWCNIKRRRDTAGLKGGWRKGPHGPSPMNKSETKHLFALTLPSFLSLPSPPLSVSFGRLLNPFFARSVGHSRRNRVLNPLVDLSVDFLKKGREGWFLNGYINPQRKLRSLMPRTVGNRRSTPMTEGVVKPITFQLYNERGAD